jgi:hypothetical protein
MMKEGKHVQAQEMADPVSLASFYLVQRLFGHLIELKLLRPEVAMTLVNAAAEDASAVMEGLSSVENEQASEILRGYSGFLASKWLTGKRSSKESRLLSDGAPRLG